MVNSMKSKPNLEEIERGLTHRYPGVRIEWTERMDFTPTPEQIERGLNDEDRGVRIAWEKRLRKEMSDAILSDDENGYISSL